MCDTYATSASSYGMPKLNMFRLKALSRIEATLQVVSLGLYAAVLVKQGLDFLLVL